jgi:CheY-like chemotaxis protein
MPSTIQSSVTRSEDCPAAQTEPGRLTVLVVDDTTVDRRFAGGLAERNAGWRAVYASDGNEAMEVIEKEAPDAVLTDLQMSGMDGLQLVKAIREKYPHIPVILMTAFGSEQLAIQALQAGATGYVPKNVLSQELAPTLKSVSSIITAGHRRRRMLGCLEGRDSRFCLDNDPELVAALIDLFREDLESLKFGDETTRMRVTVALQEALANALFHGNLEVSSDLRQDDERKFFALAAERREQPPFRERRVHIHAAINHDVIVYTIRDEGPGYDTAAADRPIDPEDLMRIGGRGLLLIRAFMDEVTHNDKGNQITMIKHAISVLPR